MKESLTQYQSEMWSQEKTQKLLSLLETATCLFCHPEQSKELNQGMIARIIPYFSNCGYHSSNTRPARIRVWCSLPHGKRVFIRGSGNGLSWDKGKPLIRLSDLKWVYLSPGPLKAMEYKFLIDDSIWQVGDNLKIGQDEIDDEFPVFPSSSVSMTQITVNFDAGYGNTVFIRGNGPGLSWEKGVELRNISSDIWVMRPRKILNILTTSSSLTISNGKTVAIASRTAAIKKKSFQNSLKLELLRNSLWSNKCCFEGVLSFTEQF